MTILLRSFPAMILIALVCDGGAAGNSSGIAVNRADSLAIGRKIWQNECAGTVEGLTSWNKGEDFASLGIGHFIWYPAERKAPSMRAGPS